MTRRTSLMLWGWLFVGIAIWASTADELDQVVIAMGGWLYTAITREIIAAKEKV